jgi:DNA end-binding protein Ku
MPRPGEELERRDLVKGCEFRKNQYLLLIDEDFDSVRADSSSVMTVEMFVETDSIDPVYYDAAYFLAPDGDAGRDVYIDLMAALKKSLGGGARKVSSAEAKQSRRGCPPATCPRVADQ